MQFIHAGEKREIAIARLAIAGWAGRDEAAVRHHIRELEALGVAPPSATPLFYRVEAARLTQARDVEVLGEAGSGEVEVCLIGDEAATLWVTLASDYTDRALEAWSVAHAKQLCAKPLGSEIWPLAEVIGHWDSLVLESRIDGGTLYQRGPLSALLPIDALLSRLPAALSQQSRLKPGSALLCGTLPVRGSIRFSKRFEMTLHDPIRARTLEHTHRIHPLPVAR